MGYFMKKKSLMRGIIHGKQSPKQAVMDGLGILTSVVIVVGLLEDFLYYGLSIFYRGEIPLKYNVFFEMIANKAPYIGPPLSLILTLLVIHLRFKRTPTFALIQSLYISAMVGIFALFGYIYFKVTPILFSAVWLTTSFGMVGLSLLTAHLSKAHANQLLSHRTNLFIALSARELELTKLVQKGLSNKEISKELFISEETVKTHLKNIFKKLKISKRFELIHTAQDHFTEKS